MSAKRDYRGLLRELRKSSIFHPSARNAAIRSNLRTALFGRMLRKEVQSYTLSNIENTVAFLRANRAYKDVMRRYSPFRDLSGEERVQATARRVGLNMPKEYKLSGH